MARYGLRIGEVGGLQVRDLNLTHSYGVLTISKQLLRDNWPGLGPLKTQRSNRVLILDEEVTNVLRSWLKHRPVKDLPFLFSTRRGTAIHAENILDEFQAHLERIHLPRMELHGLRRSAATIPAPQRQATGRRCCVARGHPRDCAAALLEVHQAGRGPPPCR